MSEDVTIKDESVVKKREAHVSEEKKKEVVELKKLINDHNFIAIVNLVDLPSNELQVMRKKLKENSIVKVSKKRLIKIALNESKDKKGITDLIPCLEKVTPGIIFSKDNCFKLANFLRKNKSKVSAKPGQIAPKDLSVNAGPTPFTPGPIIGELGSMGVKATVEEGKIVVKEDAVVVKEGEEINSQVADLLAKLDVKPMEIGLNLAVAYEDGTILDKDVLDFDDGLYLEEIKRIASDAFKLTVSIGYVTKENVSMLLSKAENEAKALIEKAGIITNDSVKGMVAKAESHAETVKDLVKEPVLEEDAHEKKVEEKKEGLKEEDAHKISEENKTEDKMDTKNEEIPTAEELAEKKKVKDIEDSKEVEEENKKEESKAPSLHELVEKKEEKTDEVPSIDELAEKKKHSEEEK
jgi:large subunit ribosomal protein L10